MIAPVMEYDGQSTSDMYKKTIMVQKGSPGSYANIPEALYDDPREFKFYYVMDGIKTDVTFDPTVALEFMDTDSNGVNDKIEWAVPAGVTEFYIEAEISIINVKSFPTVGDEWIVEFETIGTADLTITAID